MHNFVLRHGPKFTRKIRLRKLISQLNLLHFINVFQADPTAFLINAIIAYCVEIVTPMVTLHHTDMKIEAIFFPFVFVLNTHYERDIQRAERKDLKV